MEWTASRGLASHVRSLVAQQKIHEVDYAGGRCDFQSCPVLLALRVGIHSPKLEQRQSVE